MFISYKKTPVVFLVLKNNYTFVENYKEIISITNRKKARNTFDTSRINKIL